MRQRLIITELEKKTILSLYEQTDEQYKKENDFLQRYVGKTFNLYQDPQFQKLYFSKPFEIKTISYKGFFLRMNLFNSLNPTYYDYTAVFRCQYNPDKIGYENENFSIPTYNKTLIDNINQQGTAFGIKWCQKPKADFGMKQISSDTDKMV